MLSQVATAPPAVSRSRLGTSHRSRACPSRVQVPPGHSRCRDSQRSRGRPWRGWSSACRWLVPSRPGLLSAVRKACPSQARCRRRRAGWPRRRRKPSRRARARSARSPGGQVGPQEPAGSNFSHGTPTRGASRCRITRQRPGALASSRSHTGSPTARASSQPWSSRQRAWPSRSPRVRSRLHLGHPDAGQASLAGTRACRARTSRGHLQGLRVAPGSPGPPRGSGWPRPRGAARPPDVCRSTASPAAARGQGGSSLPCRCLPSPRYPGEGPANRAGATRGRAGPLAV